MIESLLTAAVNFARDDGPGVFWCGAMVIALAAAVRAARLAGLDPRTQYWAAALALLGGVCGSRLLGMVVYDGQLPRTLTAAIVGGHSWYGGLIVGAALALAFLRARRAPVLRHADALAGAAALGYAIGRIGCFLNGCDYGVRTAGPFAVRYPPDTEAFVAQLAANGVAPWDHLSAPVLPVQLLHALLGLALFVVLRREQRPGRALAVLALGYGLGRFALEFLRGDFTAAVGPLSLHQAISLVLIAAGAALLLRREAPVVAEPR